MTAEIKSFAYLSPEYQQALELRDRVLRQPLGLRFTPAELLKDEKDVHFGLFENGTILACLILTETESNRMKMRQVAVAVDRQGQGLGKDLNTAAEKYALKHGFTVMFCHARKSAVPFYENLGYRTVGEEFTEVNIPHFLMEKSLS